VPAFYKLEAVMGDRPSSTPLAVMTSLNEPDNYVMSDANDEGTKALETSYSVKLVPNAKCNADSQLSFKKKKKSGNNSISSKLDHCPCYNQNRYLKMKASNEGS